VAEHAVAKAFQQHSEAVGLSAWAGQVIGSTGPTWFGGVELSPAINTTAPVSVDVQQLDSGLDHVMV
jgi:hypothetical protein